jgi:hypothetical protein
MIYLRWLCSGRWRFGPQLWIGFSNREDEAYRAAWEAAYPMPAVNLTWGIVIGLVAAFIASLPFAAMTIIRWFITARWRFGPNW